MCPDYIANADTLPWWAIGVLFAVLVIAVLITPTTGR